MKSNDDPFYSPGPYPDDEPERQRVVDQLVRARPDFSDLEQFVAQTAALFQVPSAAITILDGHRQWIPVRTGMPVSTTQRSEAFCGHTILQSDPLIVLDASQDERFEGNPLVLGDLSVRFHAGARIVLAGAPIGALCALGPSPLQTVNDEQLDRLRALSRQVAEHLATQLALTGGEARSTPFIRVVEGNGDEN